MLKNALRALALVLVAPTLFAATYIVPTDAEMIQQSDDIVVATALTSKCERTARGIVTRYTLQVEEALKGDAQPGRALVITEQGGAVGGKYEQVSGAPVYLEGQRYLVFATMNERGEHATYGMAVGQFMLIEDRDRTLALRFGVDGFNQNLDAWVEKPRDAEGFAGYIRGIVARRNVGTPQYFTQRAMQPSTQWKVESQFTRNSYLVTTSNPACAGCAFRWSAPSYGFVRSGAPSPGTVSGPDAATHAIDAWDGTGTAIDVTDDGVDNTAIGGFSTEDGKNAILFNDPNGEVSAPAIGIAKIRGNGTYPLSGEPADFIDMSEVDVIMDNISWSQCLLNVATTHEVGHTLGFRHSNQNQSGGGCAPPLDCTGSAVMNSSVSCGTQESLEQWDSDAANTVYGSGPVCNPAAISTSPQSKTVSLNSSSTLTVVATGTAPIGYQWFTDGDAPVGTNSPTLQLNTSAVGVSTYYVKVTNACNTGAARSATATVTVTCDNPAITSNPQSANIIEGQFANLTVGANGSSLQYQWYVGNSGDTSNPVANSNFSHIAPAPVVTTNYWVRVSGACGSPVDSATATISVTPCDDVTVDNPTATPMPGVGKYTLSVTAFSTSTPLSFQWIKGTTPGFGGQQAGTGQSINVTVTATTSYWVRVTNACGKSEFSGLITVAPCTLPSITTQPADQQVSQGASATLTIVHTGTSVKWFRGLVGDMTTQVGSANTLNTGPLTTITNFWAQVTNACGSVSSRQVVVTVEQLSDTVKLLNQRFTVQVHYINQFENPPVQGILKGRSLFSSSISETAIFTFGDPLVVELMVRVSDTRPFANRIDLYYGSVSDVEFFIDVTDSLTGITKQYHKAANELNGEVDRVTFPAQPAIPSLGDGVSALMAQTLHRGIAPLVDTSTIRLLNNRYEVRMTYRNQFENPATEGFLLSRSIASSPTTETAIFYFNQPESVEWLVRFSDARPFVQRIDMFHGGLSDVEFTIEVTDTVTGAHHEYHKDPFSLAGQVDRTSYVP